MKNEIDKDFYCLNGFLCTRIKPEECLFYSRDNRCFNCHRKWPTPEQFKEDYGEEYAGHRPVWWKFADDDGIWRTRSYNGALELISRQPYRNVLIVCACTPCDRPPADWRP